MRTLGLFAYIKTLFIQNLDPVEIIWDTVSEIQYYFGISVAKKDDEVPKIKIVN